MSHSLPRTLVINIFKGLFKNTLRLLMAHRRCQAFGVFPDSMVFSQLGGQTRPRPLL